MSENQVAESAKSADVRALREAFTFFRENAGYATPPGRAACALDLARAERSADRLGWFVACESDADGWATFGDDQPYFVAALCVDVPGWSLSPRVLTALSGIDVDDAEAPDYWRVIRAELAAQVIAENGWETLADDWMACTPQTA